MIIVVTGHRPDKLNNEWDMQGPVSTYLSEAVQSLIERHSPEFLVSGMALGFDMISALTALSVGLPVLAAVPCKGQESLWRPYQQELYRNTLAHKLVTVHVCYAGPYSPWVMNVRNEWMVNLMNDPEDILVAAWDGTPGGTTNCLRYAEKRQKKIVVVEPEMPPEEMFTEDDIPF